MRVILLGQNAGSFADVIEQVLPLPRTADAADGVPQIKTTWPPVSNVRSRQPTPRAVRFLAVSMLPGDREHKTPVLSTIPLIALSENTITAAGAVTPAIAVQGQPPPITTPTARRWSASSWMIARTGIGGDDTLLAPQLGGTQAGVRVDYRLGHGLSATGRLAAPAAETGREVSVGIAWRPAGIPVRLVVEQRLALDGARGGPAFGISGGVDAAPLPAGFRLEGYGQAGAILRDGIERFVDGSARATRPIVAVDGIRIDAGVGSWGGAQRGVARLDIGPTIGVRVPLAGQQIRLAIDWRERIVGRARPGSGPALTMGMDY